MSGEADILRKSATHRRLVGSPNADDPPGNNLGQDGRSMA
jgi:hypothetical protein